MKLIVAVDEKWGIGKNGDLLLSIPDDMMYYRTTTRGKVVVMGYTTLLSLPNSKPAPARLNLVLADIEDLRIPGAVVCGSMEQLLRLIGCFYPDDVFSTYIGVSIQTMVHHGVMVIIGIFVGGRLVREGKMTLPRFFKADAVFAVLVLIALIMNIAAPLVTDMTFNMFFIGPNFPCQLVFLNVIYANVPYPLFLIIYMFGFTLAAFILFWLQQILRPSWYKSIKEKRRI